MLFIPAPAMIRRRDRYNDGQHVTGHESTRKHFAWDSRIHEPYVTKLR
jgi:hypothetical protein